ncbi:hypothetical protein D3C87_847170 [compost metagenome]
MVSRRCKMMVKSELDKLGIAYTSIELGEVRLAQPISEKYQTKTPARIASIGARAAFSVEKEGVNCDTFSHSL